MALKSASSNKKKSSFQYTPPSKDKIKERAEQQGGMFDSIFKNGIDTFTAREGDNTFRILPGTWDGHDHYAYDIWVHSWVGADKGTYLCPAKMLSKKCPICEAEREAKQAGEEEEAKALRATRRCVCWIVNRDSDNETVPELYSMSWSMERDIAALCQIKKTGGILLIDHPTEGYDVSFRRQGKGLNTRYVGVAIERELSPIFDDDNDQEKVLEYINENPIPSVLNFYSAEHLLKVISGTAEKDEDEDDDDNSEEEIDETPRRVKKRGGDEEDSEEDQRSSAKGKKPAQPSLKRRSEEENEEPNDEEVDEEEEDTPPKKPSKPQKKRAEPEEDEEEEQEERKPAKPARRAVQDEEETEEQDEEEEEETLRRPVRRGGGR